MYEIDSWEDSTSFVSRFVGLSWNMFFFLEESWWAFPSTKRVLSLTLDFCDWSKGELLSNLAEGEPSREDLFFEFLAFMIDFECSN